MKEEGKDFSRRVTPLFETMMVQPNQDEGVDSGIPYSGVLRITPLLLNHHPLYHRRKHRGGGKSSPRRKQRMGHCSYSRGDHKQDDKTVFPTRPSNDPHLSGEDSMQKNVQSYRCWKEKGNQELQDSKVLMSEVEGMFDTNDLNGDEVNVDMPVGEKQEQSAKEREVDTSVEDSAAPTTIEEITLAQTLIQIKAAKPKVVTTAATTTTTTRPKARGVVVQEPSEFRTLQESQPSMIKDKGKAIMIEPEVPLKRKDQVALDEDLARNLQAQLEAELIEEERLARK
ncbi:hypothetical protein Tco_0368840 [Tanacetum coccineum]